MLKYAETSTPTVILQPHRDGHARRPRLRPFLLERFTGGRLATTSRFSPRHHVSKAAPTTSVRWPSAPGEPERCTGNGAVVRRGLGGAGRGTKSYIVLGLKTSHRFQLPLTRPNGDESQWWYTCTEKFRHERTCLE